MLAAISKKVLCLSYVHQHDTTVEMTFDIAQQQQELGAALAKEVLTIVKPAQWTEAIVTVRFSDELESLGIEETEGGAMLSPTAETMVLVDKIIKLHTENETRVNLVTVKLYTEEGKWRFTTSSAREASE